VRPDSKAHIARLVLSCCLAAICVLVLGDHVYRSFNRIRVRVVTQPTPAHGSSMVIPLPEDVGRLTGQPIAVILRVGGTSEPLDFTLSLDGRQLAGFSVPADREVRIDTSTAFVPVPGQEVSLQATRAGWTLAYLELATVHGYSRGLFSFVIVPQGGVIDHVLPTGMLIVLFLVLAALRPRLDWPHRRTWRVLHRAAAGLILLVFAVVLSAHVFTPYLMLVALYTWVLCLAVLYAEPISRAWRYSKHLPAFEDGLSPTPWWITALDVVCLMLVAVMVRSMLGDTYSLSFTADISISLPSWPSIALCLAVLLALRQRLAGEAVPWHWRVYAWLRSFCRWEPLRAAWPPFVTTRLVVLIAGSVAVQTFGFNPPRPWRALSNDLLDLYARWDAGWYFVIASGGYGSYFNPQQENAIAFFPGLPLLMRLAGVVLDANLWIAGIVVVTVSFLAALTYLYRLARLDLTPDQARASLMFLAFYPFAFCYSAVLTESVFLLAAVAAFYYFRRDQFWKAAFFGLMVGLLRPNGFLLSVPLALIALLPFARSRGWLRGTHEVEETNGRRLFVQVAIACMPVVGMLVYAVHVNSLTGNPFAFVAAQQAWGRKTLEGFTVADARSALIESQGLWTYLSSYPIEVMEATAAFFALVAVRPIVRRFGLAYGVFVALSVLPPLVSMGATSLGRYTAPLFPIFLWLGASVPPERRPYWIAVFAAGQALLAALFFTWRPPY